tara:strand:- start:13931 stop:14659 length:729 start_codon:yes stop_codon:yes gene_type:complete
MAINVDTVYQKVLAIANKEQRGYITPQEFNLFANQAQLGILEQHLYDINQFGRIHGNDTEYSDMLGLLNEKLAALKSHRDCTYNTAGGFFRLPVINGQNDVYKLGTVEYSGKEVEEVAHNELLYINLSPLAKPTKQRPIYVHHKGVWGGEERDVIYVYPKKIKSGISCTYINKPQDVRWGYIVVNEKALYDGLNSTNFQLHPSDEVDLVIKILKLAGVSMKNMELVQGAATEEAMNIQQEKQ